MTDDSLVRVIVAVRNGLTQIVEELNTVLQEMAPKEGWVDRGQPILDLKALEAAGWISYRTKAQAQPGEAGWIKNPAYFTDFEAPPAILSLVKALTKAEAEKPGRAKSAALQLGDYTYSFRSDAKFLQRQPTKKELKP